MFPHLENTDIKVVESFQNGLSQMGGQVKKKKKIYFFFPKEMISVKRLNVEKWSMKFY